MGILILGFFFIPIKTQWVEDKYIYGGYFCYTKDGSCIYTGGHKTLEFLTAFELLKYKIWEDKTQQKEAHKR